LRDEVAALCEALEIRTCAIEAFDPRSPHSNKIRALLEWQSGAPGRVVFTDVDVVFSCPLPLEHIHSSAAGKLVDQPNPPLNVLWAVFAEAGIAPPAEVPAAGIRRGAPFAFETLPGNFNGGLYIVAAACVDPLGKRWAYWARWLLDRLDLLERWRVHVDQVSFCLAVNELGVPLQTLGAEWNYPAHHLDTPVSIEPYIVHHHARLTRENLVEPTGAPNAAQAIARVNACLQTFYPAHLTHPAFWNHRPTADA
jgi:hypothetical protein